MQVQLTLKRVFNKGHLCFELPGDPGTLSRLRDLLTLCKNKNNDFVSVTLARPRKPRTTGDGSQNHHLNGHIMQICQETGNDYETVKNAVKMIAVENLGYPYAELHGTITPRPESESSTEECAKLIEAAHLLAAELEIILQE